MIDGRDLLSLEARRAASACAAALISYVPQDPGSALNPALRIRPQLLEILEAHGFGPAPPSARSASTR